MGWCYFANVHNETEGILSMPFFLTDAWKAGELTVQVL